MKRVHRDQLIYAFDARTPPVLTIEPGETVVIETHDTTTNRVHKVEDFPAYLATRNPLELNPAGGPIFVNGAEPGDSLAITILDIHLGAYGYIRALSGAGVLQDGIDAQTVMMVHTEGDMLNFGGKVRFKARPLVGVLGTAPAEGTLYTVHPGLQGSNMDFNVCVPGATVHLPVEVPGGLLSIGDVHASGGDGEVGACAIEMRAEVTVRVDLEKDAAPKRPWIENNESWIATGQGPTLEEAVHEAVDGLTTIVQRNLDLSRTDAFLLVSARGDVRIGQSARIPGCDSTVYAVFPKAVERIEPE